MIYPIVVYGDPVLKKVAVDIEKDSIDVKQLAADMYETMYAANGVGIAAPQIGKSIRMFVVDAEPFDKKRLKGFKKIFINPVIIKEEGEEWAYEEGCLSIPGVRYDVYRPSVITIKYFDENWVEHTETFDDLKARVIQHEYDHIQGILFVDHLSALKKQLIKGKLTNISRGKCEADYRIKAPGKR
jgi:peptide deformylase